MPLVNEGDNDAADDDDDGRLPRAEVDVDLDIDRPLPLLLPSLELLAAATTITKQATVVAAPNMRCRAERCRCLFIFKLYIKRLELSTQPCLKRPRHPPMNDDGFPSR